MKVGTFGSAARRCGADTTIGIRRPLWMKGMAEGMLSNMIGTWPATTSLSAGPAPRYGMCVTKVLVRLL